MKPSPLITRVAKGSLESVCERLPAVSQKHGFGVLGTHNLKEKMMSKGVAFDRECRVFEVCNPHQAKKVLDQAIEVSTALPCRVAVYEKEGKAVLATIKPTLFLTLYEMAGAQATAEEVEASLVRIMDEVANG